MILSVITAIFGALLLGNGLAWRNGNLVAGGAVLSVLSLYNILSRIG